MIFKEKTTLDCRGPIEQLSPEPVRGTLLVSQNCIANWEEDHSQFGFNEVGVFPAYHNGEKSFVVVSVWESSPGYCCSGLSAEKIITFVDGVELLLKHGAYEHLWGQ
jgi:hypothetical protein